MQQGLIFPHQDGMDALHSNVVLDGELVIDTDPKTGQVGHLVISLRWPSSSSMLTPPALLPPSAHSVSWRSTAWSLGRRTSCTRRFRVVTV